MIYLHEIFRYIVFFFIFSLFGWIWESIYCTICEKKWQNRGFLYGPICPIYGFGSIAGLAIYDLEVAGVIPQLEWWLIFLIGFAVSMILEYPISWALEKLFHARWWDYSDLPLNIGGRTSVPTSAAFGGAAILIMRVALPEVDSIISPLPELAIGLSSLVLVCIVSADLTLTVSALTDFQKYIDMVDESFQTRMLSVVDNIFETQSSFKQKTINRIKTLKLPKKTYAFEKEQDSEFEELIKDYLDSDVVRQMDNYMQHGNTTTLQHSENVARVSYIINKKLHLNSDEKELVEAAILHDLFLYDWHYYTPLGRKHGFSHPYVAAENAENHFGVSEKVRDAIRSHMWPLTITEIPKSKEAIIVCIADKYCAIIETLRLKNKNKNKSKNKNNNQ